MAFGILTIALPARAFAAVAGGGVLPWDAPLNTLQTDLQGPVAHAITTAAIIGTGHHVVGERARHRRPQDVGGGLWRRGGPGRHHADDGAVPAGRSALLTRKEDEP